jgi:hypothetical protein
VLNLALTTDKISVITSSTANIAVHASFVDYLQSPESATPGKQNTAITTATTTDIVAAPAASTFRNVKFLSLRNKHASTANDVTVQFDANGTLFELIKCTLLAGEELVCREGVWFHFDTNGGVYGAILSLADPRFTTKLLLADQSNSTTTLTEVTGLSVPAGVGTWHFKYILRVQSAAATTGHRFSVNHDGTVAWFLASVTWPGGTTAASDAVDQDFVAAGGMLQSGFFARAKSTTGWGTTLSVDTLNADVCYEIEGIFEVTVAGNIELWHGSEVAAASTVKAGSMLILDKAA